MTESELPENETVLLVTSITRVMNSPEVIEGETSGTGKTISAPKSKHSDGSVRLDTETILSGDSEYRDTRSYELYTPARLQKRQQTNHAPGPQAGANHVSEPSELPEPTHWPRVDQPDDLPEECPNCGSEAAPFQVDRVASPRCEACGNTLEESEENGDEPEDSAETDEVGEESTDPLEMSTWDRGDVFAIDGKGEVLLTRIRGRMATTGAEAVDRAGTEYVVRTQDVMGPTQLLLEDAEESSAVVMVEETDSYGAEAVEYAGENTDWLRRWIRQSRGDGGSNDDHDGGGGGGSDRPDDAGGGQPEIRADGGGQTALSDFER
ncbi:hypothetical protein [Natronomonas marina]|uniref:hypothetical protein n=1 Tax=Natronomonas marina TaxID=2961939 RepID=UPI0020C9FC3F|nr:hypothetical protein [Natronomonas marina]